MIEFSDFEKINVRVGKIIEIEDYHEARKSSFVFVVDLGPELGTRKSIAKLSASTLREN